ncbi:hypothetical protein E0Z10_g11014, partial [Xylaria hypoxylon]
RVPIWDDDDEAPPEDDENPAFSDSDGETRRRSRYL